MGNEIRIAAVGDVMCGDSFYALGQGVDASLRHFGEGFLPTDVADHLRSHTFALCNVECVLSDIGRNDRSMRRTQMRGRPQYAQYLQKWGFNVAAVANNHILEHGREAAVDTAKQLRSAGIDVIGAGSGATFGSGVSVVEKTVGAFTVVFIGACRRNEKYAYNGGAESEDVLAAVKRCSRKRAVPIVSLHWGDEFVDRPSLGQRDYVRQLFEAGAVAVIGHHPHVVQGLQHVNGRIAAFSLGNFMFDSFVADTRWSIILSMTIADGAVKEWGVRFIESDNVHRPQFAAGIAATRLIAEFDRRCRLLDMPVSDTYESQYLADVESSRQHRSRQLRKELLRRLTGFRPIYLPQLLARPFLRRIGAW